MLWFSITGDCPVDCRRQGGVSFSLVLVLGSWFLVLGSWVLGRGLGIGIGRGRVSGLALLHLIFGSMKIAAVVVAAFMSSYVGATAGGRHET